MEDCCAVCAEPLEWIAYGPCGHREVCSTCTARLRVVLDDKHCCICKQECPVVYVTKAMGDYTKVVSDFNTLGEKARQGSLWFESDIGAYFDDEDEFKRIKAMCRLQCKLCENAGNSNSPPVSGAVRKGYVFRNLELLRRHIFGAHKLIMCSLCLEGRKVFIQDQKLYTRGQLERHSSKGDSFADGTEEERGGFTGHPMCAFCTRRFYSDNELYHHMSTEHFTCHLCQRSRPGQFDYYQNYDDLESHFRNEHALCEDPECLAKKFIVFVSEGELKVHNAKEHGGSLTRAQRNAALKIPVSYQLRRPGGGGGTSTGGDRRGNSYYRGNRGSDLNTELLSSDSTPASAAAFPEDAGNRESFPALESSSSAASSAGASATEAARWVSALHGGSQSNLSECAFPPLPGASAPHQARQHPQQRPLSSLFTARKGKVKVLNAAKRLPPAAAEAGDDSRAPETRAAPVFHSLDYPELPGNRAGHSVGASKGLPLGSSSSSASSGSTPAGALQGAPRHADAGGGGGGGGGGVKIGKLSMEEIRAATKVLQEQIREQLRGDEQQFGLFKEVHAQFRKGELSAELYYERVAKLGLISIIPELARLCPDEGKQRELLEVMRLKSSRAPGLSNGYRDKGLGKEERRIHKPAPEEEVEVEILSTDGYRRKPSGSSSSKPPDIVASGSPFPASAGDWSCGKCTLVNPARSFQCSACGAGRSSSGAPEILQGEEPAGKLKKKKAGKVSKFIRNRLGEIEDEAAAGAQSSAAAAAAGVSGGTSSSEGVVRGAWRNNGGQRLVAMTSGSSSASSSAWNKIG